MPDNPLTKSETPVFDFNVYPPDTMIHERRAAQERRSGEDRRQAPTEPPRPQTGPPSRRQRRRRIDPTTFEKQYTEDELEFMTAMQCFKVQTGRSFPTHGEVLRVAHALGYRKG